MLIHTEFLEYLSRKISNFSNHSHENFTIANWSDVTSIQIHEDSGCEAVFVLEKENYVRVIQRAAMRKIQFKLFSSFVSWNFQRSSAKLKFIRHVQKWDKQEKLLAHIHTHFFSFCSTYHCYPVPWKRQNSFFPGTTVFKLEKTKLLQTLCSLELDVMHFSNVKSHALTHLSKNLVSSHSKLCD